MPGKPGQSMLIPYDEEIHEMISSGVSYRAIAENLNSRHELKVTHNAVYSYVRAKRRRHQFHRSFMAGLDNDIRDDLWRRLVAEWTHDSTAIEGNTLTLGETFQVLQLGLTINGKSLKDHEEVHGHARAIDLLYQLLNAKTVTENSLFDLHQSVMPKVAVDSMKPAGGWKHDYNGTTGLADEKPVYMEYANPNDTPHLMTRWLEAFNDRLDGLSSKDAIIDTYVWCHMTFVRIHPFFDGNGRLARLLANLPLLRNGFPPITIASDHRPQYIQVLWEYQYAVGKLSRNGNLLPDHQKLSAVKEYVVGEWKKTMGMVAEAKTRQQTRYQE